MRNEPLRLNFTKKGIEALASGPKRIVWHDTATRGLCLRIEPTGRKSFGWFRKVNGRPTWKSIGLFPELSIEQARNKAGEYNGEFADWRSNEFEGPSPLAKHHDLTLQSVLDDYIERHVRAHAKNPDIAIQEDRRKVNLYCSAWKTRKVGSIQKEDILALHTHIGKTRGQIAANRVIQLLRRLFNWAREEMNWSGENPVKRRFKFFHENSRERYLTPAEMRPFFEALASEPSRDLRDFIVCALFTAARRSDVLSMRWEDLTFHKGSETWRVPNPKSKKPYTVQLIPQVVAILQQRREAGSGPWVFPGRGKTKHLTGFKHSWAAFLKRAGVTNFRVHDLRRTLGSWLASRNTSLQVIGATLGHQSSSVTAVYARLRPDTIRTAVDQASQEMIAASKMLPAVEQPKKTRKKK